MTKQEKQKLLVQFAAILDSIPIENESKHLEISQTRDKPKLLTIKECTKEIDGLSEHTIRQLITRNELPYIRSGAGKRGKILVNRADLLNFFGIVRNK